MIGPAVYAHADFESRETRGCGGGVGWGGVVGVGDSGSGAFVLWANAGGDWRGNGAGASTRGQRDGRATKRGQLEASLSLKWENRVQKNRSPRFVTWNTGAPQPAA